MAKKDMGIPEKRSDYSEIDINREKRSGAEQPGKTPGQAEGEDSPKRQMPYPNGPGKTPGSAEG
jgi:hypothetical protein